MPNQDQTMSLVRAALMFIGNMLVADGFLTASNESVLFTSIITILGAAITAAPIIWGVVAHSHTAMIQAVNAANNGVKVVAATAQAAQVTASLK